MTKRECWLNVIGIFKGKVGKGFISLPKKANFSFAELGLTGNYEIRDLWQHKVIGKGKKWDGKVISHETKLFRLKKI